MPRSAQLCAYMLSILFASSDPLLSEPSSLSQCTRCAPLIGCCCLLGRCCKCLASRHKYVTSDDLAEPVDAPLRAERPARCPSISCFEPASWHGVRKLPQKNFCPGAHTAVRAYSQQHGDLPQKDCCPGARTHSRGAYSQQGCWSEMLRRAFQTALLHLKPPPKPSCQMRSPRFMPLVCSILDRMYLCSAAPRQMSHVIRF